jgi:hypothetical protein
VLGERGTELQARIGWHRPPKGNHAEGDVQLIGVDCGAVRKLDIPQSMRWSAPIPCIMCT